ncbi:MAG: hypothetical protein KAJ19_16995, partial [Gammaproteobacteria bacterium]|nr:hypothetical protein [Gammaproteobacteria bacterium]
VIKVYVNESGRERPSYGSSRYVSGTRWVPNPAYQQAQGDLQMAQQRVLQSQTDLNTQKAQQNQLISQSAAIGTPLGGLISASIGMIGSASVNQSKGDLAKAQSRLASTPMQIEEDVHSDYRYEIFDLNLHGEVVISFKMINYTTSEISQVHTIRKTDVVKDQYIPGDPSKNVQSDPNELPTHDEFKQKLLALAIDETFEAMKKELSVNAENYYRKGKKAAKNKIEDEAIENYMRYLYSAPSLSNPRVQEANEYLYKNLGLSVIRRKY